MTILFPSISDSALGFERLFDNMHKVAEAMSGNQNFPPHSVVKLGEDSYEITMAVAGFKKEDISVHVRKTFCLLRPAVSNMKTKMPRLYMEALRSARSRSCSCWASM